MGRDKAFLELGGQTLLARQIETARAAGAVEVFISGRADADYSAFGCRVLQDKFAGAGPLAGIERALDATASMLLLALAVDLPDMNAKLLLQLSTYCKQNTGAIPRVAGELEPLAAFYPKMAQSLAATCLCDNSNSVKNFAGLCGQNELVVLVDFHESCGSFFKNYNTPGEYFVAGR
jgi:molybdopterin-guanine dinucleotide biosynthesis protein A